MNEYTKILSERSKEIHESNPQYYDKLREDNEKKMNIFFSIPILGPATKASVAILNHAINPFVDRGSLSGPLIGTNVSDLNPLKNINDIVRHTNSLFHDYNEGIWFGTRPLAIKGYDFRISLTVHPGIDLHHYAIKINDIIYQVKYEENRNKIFSIEILRDANELSREDRTITWYYSGVNSTNVSNSELERYSRWYEQQHNYSLIPDDNGINCQIFVRDMFSFATNKNKEEAQHIMISKIGSILFG
jgi:hypothetical protein